MGPHGIGVMCRTGILALALLGAASAGRLDAGSASGRSYPPILYVQGVQCPAHVTCFLKPLYHDRIRRIAVIGLPSNPLSSGAFSDSHPVWSPDHTRIAFVRESHNGLSYAIWVMNADGGGQKPITKGTMIATEPAWAPNGKTIVFRADSPDGKTFDLYTIPVAGGTPTNITSDPDSIGALNPDWSPNSKLIVFQRTKSNSGAGTGIFTIRPDGTGLKRLTIGGQDPAWSPDGKRIAAVFPDPASGGRFQIYLMSSSGTSRKQLTTGTESTAPAWSPDGRQLVFVRGTQITVVSATGTGVKQLTKQLHALRFVDTPDW